MIAAALIVSPLLLGAGSQVGHIPLPVAEQNRRMAAYVRLPVKPCEQAIAPRDAIMLAAEAEGRPVPGCFELPVAAVGRDRDDTYLNSERDYRDQRSVAVRLRPHAAADLREAMGGAGFGDALVGQRVVVRGRVHRQRIDFTDRGRPTGKYYYQTHIVVTDVGQVARPASPPF